ncbi:mCG145641 [Mus musculus]|nr:mCG145641 [Mus musculus]
MQKQGRVREGGLGANPSISLSLLRFPWRLRRQLCRKDLAWVLARSCDLCVHGKLPRSSRNYSGFFPSPSWGL